VSPLCPILMEPLVRSMGDPVEAAPGSLPRLVAGPEEKALGETSQGTLKEGPVQEALMQGTMMQMPKEG
jgi:hypothetical protein